MKCCVLPWLFLGCPSDQSLVHLVVDDEDASSRNETVPWDSCLPLYEALTNKGKTCVIGPLLDCHPRPSASTNANIIIHATALLWQWQNKQQRGVEQPAMPEPRSDLFGIFTSEPWHWAFTPLSPSVPAETTHRRTEYLHLFCPPSIAPSLIPSELCPRFSPFYTLSEDLRSARVSAIKWKR